MDSGPVAGMTKKDGEKEMSSRTPPALSKVEVIRDRFHVAELDSETGSE
jgi:hypothetical protein